jgi:hypothetical protein
VPLHGRQLRPPATVCIGATGPRTQQRGSATRVLWTCRSTARNGAWGRSSDYPTRASVLANSLKTCRRYSRGSPCSLQYCRSRTVHAAQPARPAPQATPPAQRKRAAYGCDLCHRKLLADLRSGLGSARIHIYVDQAIAG